VTIPEGKKQLLTYHDAYAYFAKTYDWEVIGAVQPSNFEDPQPKEIARIIDQVRERDLPVIFGSEVFPSAVLEQIAAETGARYEDTLRDDDLPGEPGDPEHSWLGLMRYDYVTMIEGLGGTAEQLEALDVSDVSPDEADYPQ
jgi:ABC-type Zn uptake system ZnuABC Zn-binding protein ZnuA